MRYTRFFSLLTVTLLALLAVRQTVAQGNQEAANAAKEGMEATQGKDWNRAVEAFKKASSMDEKYAPNLAAALQQRATVYMSQQKFPEAIGDYTQAIKIKADGDTLERRAYALMQMKDYDHALGDYTEAIKLEPKDPKPYLLRSYILELKGDVKNGIADCDSVLKLQANNPEAMSRKMRLQKRAQLASQATPPPMPNGPIANPALQKAATATPTPAAPAKP